MNGEKVKLLFALLRSAVGGEKLKSEEKALYSDEMLPFLVTLAKNHDVLHLAVYGFKQNGLLNENGKKYEKEIFTAVYRREKQNYELNRLCRAFENEKIKFIPLKGSILCNLYPEPWLRTSCDIDILVGRESLEESIEFLTKKMGYTVEERATHDVSLNGENGVHVEIHFDLVEDDHAKKASSVLNSVWDNVVLHENSQYRYDMTDEFFYFYHIAHMAKHFEDGGCGIRPFIDVMILDNVPGADTEKRNNLLRDGELLDFANRVRKLSNMWFCFGDGDELMLRMQDYVLSGGVYGTTYNRVAASKSTGRVKYVFSRMFAPYSRLVRYYPVLEKHRWLMPFMQVRRWFMLLRPSVAKMAKSELKTNTSISKSEIDKTRKLMDDVGL